MTTENPRVVPVDSSNAADYVAYARRWGRDHDESYLPDEGFLPDRDHPAWLLISGDSPGSVLGALGLMLEAPYLAEKRGRITILHAESGDADHYRMLTGQARDTGREYGLTGGTLYGFIPTDLSGTIATWQGMGWQEERRAWLLEHSGPDVPDDTPPAGFSWTTIRPEDNRGLEEWRTLINRNFADLAGHVELTAKTTADLASGELNVTGGLDMLLGPDGPAGTIHVEVDEEQPHGSFLGAITVNDYLRGRGLGRLILRRGLALSRRAGLNPTWLSVNAENQNAIRLYLAEGFRELKVLVCLALEVS